jgi:hypothetical protein
MKYVNTHLIRQKQRAFLRSWYHVMNIQVVGMPSQYVTRPNPETQRQKQCPTRDASLVNAMHNHTPRNCRTVSADSVNEKGWRPSQCWRPLKALGITYHANNKEPHSSNKTEGC